MLDEAEPCDADRPSKRRRTSGRGGTGGVAPPRPGKRFPLGTPDRSRARGRAPHGMFGSEGAGAAALLRGIHQ